MKRAVEVQEASNEVFLRKAFEGQPVDEQTIAVLKALTDFPFWRTLTRAGLKHEQAIDVICGLVQLAREVCIECSFWEIIALATMAQVI